MTFADKVLTALLAFLTITSFIFIKEVMPQGSDVKIEVAGKLEYSLPISIDKTVEVNGPLGKAIVEIKDNRVSMKDAPCNNKICIHQGWIRNGAIICLPNRVIVSISGLPGKGDEGLDGITR